MFSVPENSLPPSWRRGVGAPYGAPKKQRPRPNPDPNPTQEPKQNRENLFPLHGGNHFEATEK